MKTLQIAKSLLSPPGDTIQEHLDFIGMSQAELAERMGRAKEKPILQCLADKICLCSYLP